MSFNFNYEIILKRKCPEFEINWSLYSSVRNCLQIFILFPDCINNKYSYGHHLCCHCFSLITSHLNISYSVSMNMFPLQYAALIYHHWKFYKLHSYCLPGTIYASTVSNDRLFNVVTIVSVLAAKFPLKIAFWPSLPAHIQAGLHRRINPSYHLWRTLMW